MLKENEQVFMYACMKWNEGVSRDLFHIRTWFIKKHLRNISGSSSRIVKKI